MPLALDQRIGTVVWSPVGWSLTAAQLATLEVASAVTRTYPYWHQAQFAERNPPPVNG
jgi:hypothetical protein